MKLLITASEGQIGSQLAPPLAAGHDVLGLDTGFDQGRTESPG